MGAVIKEAKTTEEINACWPVLKTLRPHLVESTLVARVKQQQNEEGFHLLYIKDIVGSNSVVTAILGYRIQNYLFSGKTLYVDDLCSLPAARGKGYAGALLDRAVEIGKAEGCDTVSLDSGYTRNDAHRLYLNKKFDLESHHFAMNLK
jgi:GNAT superfamily N-acetyltransferase